MAVVLLAGTVWLGGCAGSCQERYYASAESIQVIAVPDGFDPAPRGQEQIRIPPASSGGGSRAATPPEAGGGDGGKKSCLDQPPPFFRDERYTRDDSGQMRAPTDVRIDIRKMLTEWAQTWANRDSEAYLAFYSPSFEPEGGHGRGVWLTQIKVQFETSPADVTYTLTLAQLQIEALSDTQARVEFVQGFGDDSGGLRKELIVVLVDGAWLIKAEKVLDVL